MWEWRFFYLDGGKPEWVTNITKLIQDNSVEDREDLYFNLHSLQYGLKIRAISQNSKKLELKSLRDIKNGIEYWEKPIELPIKITNRNSLVLDTIALLEKNIHIHPDIRNVIDILNSQVITFVNIAKQRKKSMFNDITIESVRIHYLGKTENGIQLESHSVAQLSRFINRFIRIQKEKCENVSYPRLLMDL